MLVLYLILPGYADFPFSGLRPFDAGASSEGFPEGLRLPTVIMPKEPAEARTTEQQAQTKYHKTMQDGKMLNMMKKMERKLGDELTQIRKLVQEVTDVCS